MEDEDRVELNRAWWDERVAVHLAGEFYDVAGFLAGRSTLRPFEKAEMGVVAGQRLVHLQCHFGLDTLSWAREGALVTGVDFAPSAVTAARDLAREAGIGAEFVEAGVYDAVTALESRTFDVVYTSIGAIIWLPDIARWASTVASLLAPGGRFYMAEFHPFSVVLGEEELTVTDSYFDPGPFLHDEPGSYADPGATNAHRRSLTWHHGLGTVITALAQAGLRIEFLHEHATHCVPGGPFANANPTAPTTYQRTGLRYRCCTQSRPRDRPSQHRQITTAETARCRSMRRMAVAASRTCARRSSAASLCPIPLSRPSPGHGVARETARQAVRVLGPRVSPTVVSV